MFVKDYFCVPLFVIGLILDTAKIFASSEVLAEYFVALVPVESVRNDE